jgi:hypothetical protein
MASCPECGAKIESLEEDCVVTTIVAFGKSGTLIQIDEPIKDDDTNYFCPSCHEAVCDGRENAVAFLEGRVKW